jgi:hypothetical protein
MIHWFDGITILMVILFCYGFLFNQPLLFIQLNFIIKVIISFYLMYKFNDFRSDPIKFTVLDKKICYSAGFYLFIFSFADVINFYFLELRNYIQQLKIESKIM